MDNRFNMKTLTYGAVLVSIMLFFLMHSPTLLDFQPKVYSFPPVPLSGPYEINDKLCQTEHLFQGSIRGPESIVVHKGEIITGTEDGKIIKIKGNEIIELAQTGRECDLPYEERLCGRPLGLRMWKDGLLYVVDGYYGIHSMNLSNGMLTRLLSMNTHIGGQKMMFPDDLDIDDRGNIYFSDASEKWDLARIVYMIIEHEGSGRVIRYNIYSGESEVVLRDLYFPNGIQLSQDGNSLLICEILKRRILRYHLKGAKKGQVEIFIDNLPGEPDNIRMGPRGTYWVGLYTARNENLMFKVFENLGEYPLIRKILCRAVHAVGSFLVAVSELSSSHTFKEFAYRVQRGDFFISLLPLHGIIVELNEDGKVLRTFQAPDGSTTKISHVTEYDNYLYLGSVENRYLGRLKL